MSDDDDDDDVPLSERVIARLRGMATTPRREHEQKAVALLPSPPPAKTLVPASDDEEEDGAAIPMKTKKRKRRSAADDIRESETRRQLQMKQQQQQQQRKSLLPLRPSPQQKRILPDSRLRLPNKASAAANSAGDGGNLWVDRHAPKTEEELALNPRKVSEVKAWLSGALSLGDNNPPACPPHVLLLTGPSGAGRTALVRVLATASFGAELVEWSNPAFPCAVDIDGRPYDCPSRLADFRAWLWAAAKSPSLSAVGDGRNGLRVLLIEDLPFISPSMATAFRQLLSDFLAGSAVFPCIVLLSDHSASPALVTSAGSNLAPQIFQQMLAASPSTKTITVKPVPPKRMEKAISVIATAEGLQLSKRTITNIAQASHGDIRCAINTLQFQYRSLEEDKDYAEWGTRDASISIFHAVGKVLHCKRDPKTGKLESSPESVVSGCLCATPRQLVEVAFENYTGFFSSMDDIAEATECLSFGDALSDARCKQWRSDSLLGELQPLLQLHGFMISNKHASDVVHGFQAMNKALSTEVLRTAQQNCEVLGEIASSLSPRSALPRVLPIWTLSRWDIQLLIVPYGSMIPESLNFCQSILDRRQFFTQRMQQQKQQQRGRKHRQTEVLVDAVEDDEESQML